MNQYSSISGDGPWGSILYPGSEHRLDPAIGRTMTAVEQQGAGANLLYAGANYAVEGTDMGDYSNLSLQRALDVQGGGISDQQVMDFVSTMDAANFDTDFTDMDALARNARYSDQVGNM